METPTGVIKVSNEELQANLNDGAANMRGLDRQVQQVEDNHLMAQFGTIGYDAYLAWIVENPVVSFH